MKSLKPGRDISVSIENITPFGIWIYVQEKEYFLSYEEYPYFKDHTVNSLHNVQLLHGVHLYWPELDIDLEIDNLDNPGKNLLKSNIANIKESNARLAKMGGTEKQIQVAPRRRSKIEK